MECNNTKAYSNKEKTLRPRSMNYGTESLFAHRRDKDFTVVTLMAEKKLI